MLHQLRCLALGWVLLIGGLLLPQPLWAQAAKPADTNTLMGIDCQTQFPTCSTILSHPALADTLAPENITIKVDDAPVTVAGITRRSYPMQVAFVLDAPALVRRQGAPGRFIEAVRKLLDAFKATGQEAPLNDNWWAAYLIGNATPTDFSPIAEWQQGNYGEFINRIDSSVSKLPASGPQSTALFASLLTALNSYTDANATKILIVFSDGIDPAASPGLATVIQTALSKNVHVYTVLQWTDGQKAREDNLNSLATATGGQFVKLTKIDDLNPLWTALSKEQTPAVVTFPLPKAAPQKLELTTVLAAGNQVAESIDFPRLTIPALQIAGITVNNNATDRLVIGAEETALHIQLKLAGPGAPETLAARIEKVEYQFGEERFTQKVPPFDSYTLPLENRQWNGEPRALIAHVFDKYGPELRSDPINLSRLLPLPPQAPPQAPTVTPVPPEPTLAPQPTAAATATVVSTPDPFEALTTIAQKMGIARPVLLGAVAFIILVLVALLVFFLLQRRTKPAAPTFVDLQPYGLPNNDNTEPVMFDDSTNPAVDIFARATLVLERGGSELPKEIALFPQQMNGANQIEWKIGRSGAYSDYVIDDKDKRVSKLHATIFEQGGQFFIRDEGSAGGTYINRRKLTPQNLEQLVDGDVINFNTVAYRFVLGDTPQPDTTERLPDTDATEPA